MEGSVSIHRHTAAPFHEYLLQGSVVDNSCDVLLNRLRGLCDNAENDYESFHDHELVFALRKFISFFFIFTWNYVNKMFTTLSF